EEIARLFSITPQPFRLMFRWGLVTGMRRFEVLNLRRSSLMTSEQIASSGMDPIPIDITRKGGKTSTIYAPAALVEETHWFCLVDRPKPSEERFADFVFLSHRRGPFTVGTLSRTFRKYANQIGTPATLHHLRHSFAIICIGYLEALENKGSDVNPIKVVQSLLGHSNVTTTELYLRALQVSSEECP
ncbi:MAG: site-specific integrase, partial [Gammaproteobacteria bacterium]|nr:site-specific integrase [Gammaproteobacteria bacterium]